MSPPDTHPPPLLADWQPDGDWCPLGSPMRSGCCRVDLGPRASRDDDHAALPEWQFLSEDERTRGLRFVRPRDRRRFMICRGALRMILGRLPRRSRPTASASARAGGKPELAPDRRALPARTLPRFNVTHSDDLALIAFSLGRELGVDLERDAGDLARRTGSSSRTSPPRSGASIWASRALPGRRRSSAAGPARRRSSRHGGRAGRPGLPVRDDVRHRRRLPGHSPGRSPSLGSQQWSALGGVAAGCLCRRPRGRRCPEPDRRRPADGPIGAGSLVACLARHSVD